jgi:hypothetical protein
MKNYLAGLLLILVAFSCTSKKESETQVAGNEDVLSPVGIVSNGEYHIIELEENKPKWIASLKEKFDLADNASFSGFEIVKSISLGDSQEDCYLLLTNIDDFSVIAVLLELKEGKFYFDVNSTGKKRASQAIMCRGKSAAPGCNPAVLIHNKQKKLVCSDNGCEKLVSEMSF